MHLQPQPFFFNVFSASLVCNFLSASLTHESWSYEHRLIYNTWKKPQLNIKHHVKKIKIWFLDAILFCLLQLRLSFQQQNHQELPTCEPKRRRACLHHVLESNHELPGTSACTHSGLDHWDGGCVCVCLYVFWPHPLLSCSFSRSMASTWWCLMHTQSMKLLSVWTIRTQGENWSPPPAPQRQGWGKQWGKPCSQFTRYGSIPLWGSASLWSHGSEVHMQAVQGMFTKGRLVVNRRGWSLHNETGRANKAVKGYVALIYFEIIYIF